MKREDMGNVLIEHSLTKRWGKISYKQFCRMIHTTLRLLGKNWGVHVQVSINLYEYIPWFVTTVADYDKPAEERNKGLIFFHANTPGQVPPAVFATATFIHVRFRHPDKFFSVILEFKGTFPQSVTFTEMPTNHFYVPWNMKRLHNPFMFSYNEKVLDNERVSA